MLCNFSSSSTFHFKVEMNLKCDTHRWWTLLDDLSKSLIKCSQLLRENVGKDWLCLLKRCTYEAGVCECVCAGGSDEIKSPRRYWRRGQYVLSIQEKRQRPRTKKDDRFCWQQQQHNLVSSVLKMAANRGKYLWSLLLSNVMVYANKDENKRDNQDIGIV